MAQYNLLPSADLSGGETDHVWWDNGFSVDEINRIVTLGEEKVSSDTLARVSTDVIGEFDVVKDVRRSKVSWIGTNEAMWLYDRLGYIARHLNGKYFQFNVTGFYEDLQYTTYDATYEGHYDWHIDKGYNTGGTPPRKLSMVVLLSDPDEYEGGDLEIMTGPQTKVLQKTQGIVHVFPSYVLHRVTPITKGVRRSLVVWLCGPKFA